MDGYNTLFNLFITFLCIERIVSIIRGMMLHSFENGVLDILEKLFLNIVFYGYSIGVEQFFKNPFLDYTKFINYIGHAINVIPLINNFALI